MKKRECKALVALLLAENSRLRMLIDLQREGFEPISAKSRENVRSAREKSRELMQAFSDAIEKATKGYQGHEVSGSRKTFAEKIKERENYRKTGKL